MRALVLGSLLLGLGPLAGDSANGQCTYQFPASRTMLALETQTFAGYGGVVLAPGNVMAVSFSNIAVPDKSVNVTGVSLFVIPTFHVSSSALLEVAVSQSTARSGADPESTLAQGGANQREEAGADMVNIPRNASDLESRGTVSGWSVRNAPFTELTDNVWQPCRYYEVGDVEDDIRHVISDATFGDRSTEVDVFLRHHSGDVVFVEGNDDTYVNNVVLQIRGDCGWDMSKGPESSSASSSSAHTYWDYTTGSAGDHVSSAGSDNDGAPGRDAENDGSIRNGKRHPLCGGEYLDKCDLGPYLPSDVGDGSCQLHLNTEGCHYDGGDCCSVTCELATTSDSPYVCQGPELDPYYCSDPEYAIDVQSALKSEYSAATKALPFPRSIWHRPAGARAAHGDLARGGSWGSAAGLGGQVLASLVVSSVMSFAARNTVTVF